MEDSQKKIKLMLKLKSQAAVNLGQNLKLWEEKLELRVEKHDLYVNNLVGDIKANPKDFYRNINSQTKDTLGIP